MTAAQGGGEYLDRDQFEALVIGSGFGGAVAVCRLAQAGVDVAVVERGRRWPPGSFPRDLSRLDAGWLWLCDQGLYDARPLNDILAVQAAGYGGGSLVYANVAMRPPQEVFDRFWPEPYSRAALEPYYDLVAHMLDVQPVPADPRTGQLPPKTRLMAQAAGLLGQAAGFFHPNLAVRFEGDGPNRFGVPQKACTFSGQCDIGCNEGAKNTLDLNYLALAEQHGASVGTRTEAVHIARAGDGYQVRLREHGQPGAGREGVARDVEARYVFVCAGALGTTELLLRSRDQYRTLPDLPSALGHGYSGNGDFLSFGDGLRELAEPSNGPTITTAALLHTGTITDEQWFVLEEGGYSEHLAKLVRTLHVSRLPASAARLVGASTRRVLGTARDFGAALDDEAAHTAVLLAMGGDRADGRIELRGPRHRLHVTWDVTRNDPLYEAERAVSGQVVRALGGRPFGTPTWRLFRQPVTVHNLGGARIGIDPSMAWSMPTGRSSDTRACMSWTARRCPERPEPTRPPPSPPSPNAASRRPCGASPAATTGSRPSAPRSSPAISRRTGRCGRWSPRVALAGPVPACSSARRCAAASPSPPTRQATAGDVSSCASGSWCRIFGPSSTTRSTPPGSPARSRSRG